MADISQYKVGIVLSAENKGSSGQKPLKVCSVDVGADDGEPIAVVTSAVNVREGSRIVVAPVGSTIIDDGGEEITIRRTTVGGYPSEGMFCDARMLGWGAGSSSGIAVQVPESYAPGTSPPTTRPGAPDSSSVATSSAEAPGLFEKKLTKEEKKRLAEEKRKARKAAKEGKEKE
ncbi:hypothetical protein ACHAW5_008450 [Stephanodiscus triporus]|uniref:tRNA-binding domain-containing protein n=1 Tax=Stephanodiscus triporus TaxID=2934178 RepID=A0ABD3MIF2_9STRA